MKFAASHDSFGRISYKNTVFAVEFKKTLYFNPFAICNLCDLVVVFFSNSWALTFFIYFTSFGIIVITLQFLYSESENTFDIAEEVQEESFLELDRN